MFLMSDTLLSYSPSCCYQLHTGCCTNFIPVPLHTGDCKNLCAVVSWLGLQRNVGSVYDSGRPAVGLKLKSVPRRLSVFEYPEERWFFKVHK
jgi:hypothetical protein